MPKTLYFLTIPGLRRSDLKHLPRLLARLGEVNVSDLHHSFPSVTWPAQSNMLTGKLANSHGVIANGFYWDKENKVEMWTAWNEVIQQPQIWDVLNEKTPDLKTAAWFPMLSKGCGADYVCMPAPIHKPDGSEDLWCYTKPQSFYGNLLEELDHFPLKHFWGPLANIKSSQWITQSAVSATKKFHPNFFYIYIPHLDYQAQKFGPDSTQALESVKELDTLLDQFLAEITAANESNVEWVIASEYVISNVDHVAYPNRTLRESGLLNVEIRDGLEYLDFQNSQAWALVDHQFSHVFVKDHNPTVIDQVQKLFESADGIKEAVSGTERHRYNLDHERSGDVVLISNPTSWQAYYWWLDDSLAPDFARTVDIHQKPGYDPVEMFLDMTTMSVPLDATMIKGSHGIPQEPGILITSAGLKSRESYRDTDVFDIVVNHFKY